MRKVFKYRLALTDFQSVAMPPGRILSVQLQRGIPCLWALVDPSTPLVRRSFRIHGSGHEIEGADDLRYIGTVQLTEGALVFHVFEELAALADQHGTESAARSNAVKESQS